MGNLELAGTVKMLQGQRAQVQKELAKLDKAIAVLRELNGTNSTPSPTPYPLNIDRDHFIWYGSTDQDTIGRLDPKTGQVIEYPFPHTEGLMREFFTDSQGRMWYATPTNNRVGYFYLAESSHGAKK